MPDRPTPPGKGFLKRLRNALSDLGACENLDLKEAYRLHHSKVRIPTAAVPMELVLGRESKRLWLYPELPLLAKPPKDGTPDYLILDPKQYFSRISGFLRLRHEDAVTLGRDDPTQALVLGFDEDIARRHINIKLTDKGLVFKNLAPDRGACISPLLKEKKINRLWAWRHDKVQHLRQVLGAPIRTLAPEPALELLERVNGLLADEAYRPKDSRGRPGGIVHLPNDKVPVIVGDLHTCLDNLLTVLTQNQFLAALDSGDAALIVLGDAVHSEIEGQMEEMDGSLLIMDFILTLKAKYPDGVFYIRGNHDSFSEEIGKNGVPQGLLWERHLRTTRGKPYRNAMATFYANLPYLVFSDSFVACHAAAPVSKITRDKLIDIRQYPKLEREMANNRLHKPNRPGGYTNTHVKRLRKALDLGPRVPFIVGHTPLSMDDTLWAEPNNIPDHYIVYSADERWVGVMTRVGTDMLPLRYPAEPVLPLFEE